MSDVELLVNELRARGVVVHEWAGWYGRSNEKNRPHIDIRGAVIHHTGSNYGSAYLGLVQSGQAWAYGKTLCNFSGNADGSVTVLATGVTWHAGGGFGPSEGVLAPFAHDRNYYTVGLEIVYPGTSPMTDAQYATAKKFGRAVADLFADGNIEYVRGHGEVNGRGYAGKWDPGWSPDKMIDMNVFRAEARAIPDYIEPDPIPEPEEKESMFQSVTIPATLPDVITELVIALPWQGGSGGITDVWVDIVSGSGGMKLALAQFVTNDGVARKPVDMVPKGTTLTGFSDSGGVKVVEDTYALYLNYTAPSGGSLIIEAV